jgi:hypothetical protein
MPDLENVRFLTAYYSRLQGLKAVPPGLILLLVSLWLNAQTGPTRDLFPLWIWTGIGAVLYVLIDRHYHQTYGRVEEQGHSLAADVVFAAILSVVTIGALMMDDKTVRIFLADGEPRIPVSMYALLISMVFLLDYVRTCRLAGVKNLTLFPGGLVCIGLIALSAFLPLLGNDPWAVFGFRSVLFLVYAWDGILMILCGMMGHLFLVRSMRPAAEADHG